MRYVCLCGMGAQQLEHLQNHIRSPRRWAVPGIDAWHRAQGNDVQANQHGEWFSATADKYTAFRSKIQSEIKAMQPAQQPVVATFQPPAFVGATAPTEPATNLNGNSSPVGSGNPVTGITSYKGIPIVANGKCIASKAADGYRCDAPAYAQPWCGRHTQTASKGNLVVHPSAYAQGTVAPPAAQVTPPVPQLETPPVVQADTSALESENQSLKQQLELLAKQVHMLTAGLEAQQEAKPAEAPKSPNLLSKIGLTS